MFCQCLTMGSILVYKEKQYKLRNLGGTWLSTNFSWGNVATVFLLSLQFNAYLAVREITIQWKCHPKRKNGLICKEWASKYPDRQLRKTWMMFHLHCCGCNCSCLQHPVQCEYAAKENHYYVGV